MRGTSTKAGLWLLALVLVGCASLSNALCSPSNRFSLSTGTTTARRGIVGWRGGGDIFGNGGSSSQQPLMSLKLGLVRVAGYGIIAGSLSLKAPQIARVWNSRSVLGLSPASIYADVLLFTSGVLYHALKRNPFRAYGETIIVLIQTITMVGLLWAFEGNSSEGTGAGDGEGTKAAQSGMWNGAGGRVRRNLAIVTAYAALVAGSIAFLPPSAWGLLVFVATPFILGVHVPQIWQNFQQGHTGELAVTTVFLSFLGSSVRIGTTIADLGADPWLLMNYSIGAILNGIQLVQIWLTREQTAKARQAFADALGGGVEVNGEGVSNMVSASEVASGTTVVGSVRAGADTGVATGIEDTGVVTDKKDINVPSAGGDSAPAC